MKNAVLDRIIEIKDVLPKKQRILCNYLVLNYEQISLMTVAELAENAGVGTTTVMRLIQSLGFESFAAFKRALMEASLVQSTTSYGSLKQGFSDKPGAPGSALHRVAEDGAQVMASLCTPANVEQFEKAVQMLLDAKTIYTLGLRSSRALALYFEYMVERFYPHVQQLSRDTDFLYDRVAVSVTSADVLLIFSVWPCTKKTIQIGELCHRMGIPVVLLTNTSLNPLRKISDACVDTNSVNHPSGDMALFAVVEALAAELGRRSMPQSAQNIERIEQILNETDQIIWED